MTPAHKALVAAVTSSLRRFAPSDYESSSNAGAAYSRKQSVPPLRRLLRSLQSATRSASADWTNAGLMASAGASTGRAAAQQDYVVTPAPDPAGADAVCWKISGRKADQIRDEYDLKEIFPTLEIEFGGGARLKMPPERYTFLGARRREQRGGGGGGGGGGAQVVVVACLGLFDGQDETVLGA